MTPSFTGTLAGLAGNLLKPFLGKPFFINLALLSDSFLPQKRRCSIHAVPNNRISMGDGFNNLLAQVPRFDEFNHQTPSTPFRRNASTSTLDLVGEGSSGDGASAKSNHRAINIARDKSSVSNKLDFNNICGMVRSSLGKAKETNGNENVHRMGRLTPAKNVYFIEEPKDEEPNIFIIDPATINRHKKYHQLQKSLEDIRLHKMNNAAAAVCNNDCDATDGWSFMDRNYYGSRTLPRDFARRVIRPGLENLLNNSHLAPDETNR